ncbi:MAG: RNA-binding S4 domain-containing protein [Bacteroidales bacterium]|nr:RNA-binding S4 domain-containing protein [Bacteroidales bacterium]
MEKLTEDNIRIDKWLWAVRIFKTRTLATEACKKNQISIDGNSVKPSRVLKLDDIVSVKTPEMIKQYRVKGFLAKRQSAKVVEEYVENITSQEEIDKARAQRMVKTVVRDPGMGRPSKKDRRDLEQFGYLEN